MNGIKDTLGKHQTFIAVVLVAIFFALVFVPVGLQHRVGEANAAPRGAGTGTFGNGHPCLGPGPQAACRTITNGSR